MSSKHLNPAIALLACFFVSAASGGPIPVRANLPRLDRFGDPLPDSAFLRIGTVRLRHGDFVNCVRFSPDGKIIVSCSEDGTVRSWDAATGKQLHLFVGHQRQVMDLCLSKDGKTVVSISQDFTIRLWDLGTGKELRKLDAPRGAYYGISYSPDGSTMASCGASIRLWDTNTYHVIHEFGDKQATQVSWHFCLGFSPDGKQLVTGGDDGVIRYWDTTTARETRRIRAHKKGVRSIAFSPDGKYMASAGEDSSLFLRNPMTGEEVRSLFKEEPRGCSSIAFSPDSETLACSSRADSTIRMFDVSTGKEIRQLKGADYGIKSIAFSPGGKTLAADAWGSGILLWDIQTGKKSLPSSSPEAPVTTLFFCAEDTILAGATWGPTIYCWDPKTGKELRRLVGHPNGVSFCAAAADGQTLYSWNRDEWVRRWNVTNGEKHPHFRISENRVPRAVSSDGKMIVTDDFAGRGQLFDVESGKELGRFGTMGSVIFSPSGKSLVMKIPEEGLVLWDIPKAKQVRWFQGESSRCDSLGITPDGTKLAAGTFEETVQRWEMSTGDQLLSLPARQKGIVSLAFSRDGRTLASGGRDGTIWLWEMSTGTRRGILRGHQGPVFALTFSQDGRRLASGSKDTTALVWDLTDGHAAPSQADLSPKQLDDLWRDLAGKDAIKAYRSIWVLASAPKESVSFLRAHLRPVPTVEAKRMTQLLADLDSPQFDVRAKAREELEKLGEVAAGPLQKTVIDSPSVEVRRRVNELLEKLKDEKRSPSSQRVRVLRAVEVLERIGNAEARALLKDLAEGAKQAQLTQEAQASLRRLNARLKRSE